MISSKLARPSKWRVRDAIRVEKQISGKLFMLQVMLSELGEALNLVSRQNELKWSPSRS